MGPCNLIDRHRLERELPERVEVVTADPSKRVDDPGGRITDVSTHLEVRVVVQFGGADRRDWSSRFNCIVWGDSRRAEDVSDVAAADRELCRLERSRARGGLGRCADRPAGEPDRDFDQKRAGSAAAQSCLTKPKNRASLRLYFEDISSGFAVTQRSSPQAFQVIPLVVWRVYVDGRPDELVRGVRIVGTPLAAMKRILATGDKSEVFNGECGAESGTVPVSAVAPAMLMREMETQKQAQASAWGAHIYVAWNNPLWACCCLLECLCSFQGLRLFGIGSIPRFSNHPTRWPLHISIHPPVL